jgi:hypothetical protein
MEKNKGKKLAFFNPCKYCLTRAMCSKDCSDFRLYDDTLESLIFTLCLILTVSSVIILCWLLFKIDIASALKIIISLTIFVPIYGHYTKKLLFESTEEFKKAHILLKPVILIINPWGDMLCEVYDHFNMTEKIELITRRYRK